MKVRDLMQTELKTIASTATVAEAIEALVRAHVSALPVIDPHGRAVGVLSAREILRAEHDCPGAAERQTLFDDTLALEVMQAWVPTIGQDTDVRAAAERMLSLGEQRLFIEDGGELLGVISMTDIARAVAAQTV